MTLSELQKQHPRATIETWHQHINPDGSIGGWVENTARVYGNARVGWDKKGEEIGKE